MRVLVLMLLVFLSSPSAFAVPGAPLWADLDDIVRYLPKPMLDGKLLQAAVKSDARFVSGGAQFKFGPHLEYAPIKLSDGSSQYRATALMADATGRLFYRKFIVLVGGQPRRVIDVSVKQDIDLAAMHFTVNTGLIDRMVVVEDVANDVMMIYPLGVGGLDESVINPGTRILTPKFHGTFLDRKTVMPARTSPSYYRARPFIPITTAKGSATAIAFHITILDDDVAKRRGLNYLVRGFESHGCMRLREKDLMELFTILMKGGDDRIPVAVDNFVWNRNSFGERTPSEGLVKEIHPYPLVTGSYMRVTYFPDLDPHFQRDEEEHLVMMDRGTGQPDFNNLVGLSAEDLNAVDDFNALVAEMARKR